MTIFENSMIILGMFTVTFGIRFTLFARAHKVNMPNWLEHALQFVPVSVLSAIIVPMIIMPGGELTLSAGNPWLVGSLVAFIVGIWRQHQLLTIVVGVVTFFLAKFCLP
jgi:branched-subunit amino acid transport protein